MWPELQPLLWELHRVGAQRAVPARQQHARVGQKEETHPTGEVISAGTPASRAATKRNVSVWVQFEKQPLLTPSADSRTPFSRKHWRSRSLGGMIKVCGWSVLYLQHRCLNVVRLTVKYKYMNPSVWNVVSTSLCQHVVLFENRGRCWEAKCQGRRTADYSVTPPSVHLKTSLLQEWVPLLHSCPFKNHYFSYSLLPSHLWPQKVLSHLAIMTVTVVTAGTVASSPRRFRFCTQNKWGEVFSDGGRVLCWVLMVCDVHDDHLLSFPPGLISFRTALKLHG